MSMIFLESFPLNLQIKLKKCCKFDNEIVVKRLMLIDFYCNLCYN